MVEKEVRVEGEQTAGTGATERETWRVWWLDGETWRWLSVGERQFRFVKQFRRVSSDNV